MPNGTEGIAISPDGRRLYAADMKEPALHVIDTATDTLLKKVTLKNVPMRVRITPDNRYAARFKQ